MESTQKFLSNEKGEVDDSHYYEEVWSNHSEDDSSVTVYIHNWVDVTNPGDLVDTLFSNLF